MTVAALSNCLQLWPVVIRVVFVQRIDLWLTSMLPVQTERNVDDNVCNEMLCRFMNYENIVSYEVLRAVVAKSAIFLEFCII
jgi:hypothetical protein